jgi:TRAP-type uncharacterized transport system substrate-binding protein
MAQEKKRKLGRIRIPVSISRISWRDLALTLGPILLLILVAIWIALRFVRPAPPDTIVITSGPDGSQFRNMAERYRKILARNDVTLEILPSRGGLENLKRLSDPEFRVDVGFVQGGLAPGMETDELVSLGSVFYQPVMVFYRSAARIDRLSALKGQRLAIGAEGSGARSLALTLLRANGIEPGGPTRLLDLSGEAAVQALLGQKIDAVFLMGDSAVTGAFRKLLGAPGVRLFDFAQADGYMRRFRYLLKLELPAGSFDLGRNVPEKTLTLIAPTVELVARPDLHPALSDLLIEAAREVHGRGGLLQRPGEFPAPLEHEYRISDDAARFYKSGKGFLYRHFPFWLASLVDRTMLALVPIIVLLIPAVRLVPSLYQWRIRTRIFRRYGELMAVERALLSQTAPEQREALLKRVDDIEKSVISVKMPSSFATEVYVLRSHIQFVRSQLGGRH